MMSVDKSGKIITLFHSCALLTFRRLVVPKVCRPGFDEFVEGRLTKAGSESVGYSLVPSLDSQIVWRLAFVILFLSISAASENISDKSMKRLMSFSLSDQLSTKTNFSNAATNLLLSRLYLSLPHQRPAH